MSIYDYSARTLQGENLSLSAYEGYVLLIVNTASKCGFTPQYQGLQELYNKFQNRRFAVLGFPSNQFAKQEPGSNEEIGEFCQLNYGVTFPMFEKINVNGDDAHPLFTYLAEAAPGILGTKAIKWNFTKFLIGRDGQVIGRYAPKVTPGSMEKDIERLLAD